MSTGAITEFEDTNGDVIRVGDWLDIIAANQYNGNVNIEDGIVCLETAFFNKPLADHLSAIDLETVYIDYLPQ